MTLRRVVVWRVVAYIATASLARRSNSYALPAWELAVVFADTVRRTDLPVSVWLHPTPSMSVLLSSHDNSLA